MQPAGVCTRGMAKKMIVNAAVASLHAAKVPTRERTYTFSSIIAAASIVIASNSPKQNRSAEVAKPPSPNMKMAAPEKTETFKSICTASVMTVGTTTIKEQMQEMRNILEHVLKNNEEKNKKIEELRREMASLGKQKVEKVTLTIIEEDEDADKTTHTEIITNEGIACKENLLQVLIANAVKSQLGEGPSSGTCYTKPYSKRIDNLRMPLGYQPSKF